MKKYITEDMALANFISSDGEVYYHVPCYRTKFSPLRYLDESGKNLLVDENGEQLKLVDKGICSNVIGDGSRQKEMVIRQMKKRAHQDSMSKENRHFARKNLERQAGSQGFETKTTKK